MPWVGQLWEPPGASYLSRSVGCCTLWLYSITNLIAIIGRSVPQHPPPTMYAALGPPFTPYSGGIWEELSCHDWQEGPQGPGTHFLPLVVSAGQTTNSLTVHFLHLEDDTRIGLLWGFDEIVSMKRFSPVLSDFIIMLAIIIITRLSCKIFWLGVNSCYSMR